MTIEVILYVNDLNALKLTLHNLDATTDKFIIIEAKNDENGPKPRHFFRQQRYVKQYWGKIEYFLVNDIHNQEEINRILKQFNVAI